MSCRLLLLTPKFYGLELKIKMELEKLGYEVTWIENTSLKFDYHGTRSKLKILRRLYFLFFQPHVRYIKREFSKLDNTRFEILFSINCFTVSSYLFQKLKKQNPGLKSILYLWDSSAMYSWYKESGLFDKVYSFDKKDSDLYSYNYHPNFFIENQANENSELIHDIFFVGRFSPERFLIMENIAHQAIKLKLNFYVRLLAGDKNLIHNSLIYQMLKLSRFRSKWISNFLNNYEIIEGIVFRDFISYEIIGFETVQEKLSASRVVLDVPFPGQTGYSHRLIQALVQGKKLMTTNKLIKEESFYDPDQILIIDDANPVLDINWISQQMDFQGNNCLDNLELSSWLKHILNNAVN